MNMFLQILVVCTEWSAVLGKDRQPMNILISAHLKFAKSTSPTVTCRQSDSNRAVACRRSTLLRFGGVECGVMLL